MFYFTSLGRQLGTPAPPSARPQAPLSIVWTRLCISGRVCGIVSVLAQVGGTVQYRTIPTAGVRECVCVCGRVCEVCVVCPVMPRRRPVEHRLGLPLW